MKLKIKTVQSYIGGKEAQVRIRDSYGMKSAIPDNCVVSIIPCENLKGSGLVLCTSCHQIVRQQDYCPLCDERLPHDGDGYAIPNRRRLINKPVFFITGLVLAPNIALIPLTIIAGAYLQTVSLIASAIALGLTLLMKLDND